MKNWGIRLRTDPSMRKIRCLQKEKKIRKKYGKIQGLRKRLAKRKGILEVLKKNCPDMKKFWALELTGKE